MELTLNEALQKGNEARKAGQFQDADRHYTAILKAQPKHPDANHNMGVLAIVVGEIQEALPFFKTAVETKPSVTQFWLSYIDALIKLGRLADAKVVFNQAKAQGINGEVFEQLERRFAGQMSAVGKVNAREVKDSIFSKPSILDTIKLDKALSLAKRKSGEGHPEEAKKIYEDIIHKFPKNKQALTALQLLTARETVATQNPPPEGLQPIINLYIHGQLQQALSEATQMLEKFPRSVTLYNIAGASNAGLGQLDAAIDCYKQAMKINPDSIDTLNNIGNALKNKGVLEAAIDFFKKAIKIKPDYAEAYFNMGVAINNKGDPEAAIVSYKKALKINSNYAEAHNNIGLILNNMGYFQKAIVSYKKALKINQESAVVYNNMSTAFTNMSDLPAAIDSCQQALRINPEYAGAYYNMGIALEGKGDLKASLECYKEALKITPDFAEAYLNMGTVLGQMGHAQESIDCYKKVIMIKPDHAQAFMNIANTLQENGQYEQAKQCFDKLTDKDSVAKALECTYHLESYDEFNDRVESIAKTNPSNIRVAAMSAFAAHQTKQEDSYPFCKNPTEYVKFSHLKHHVSDPVKFIKTLLDESNSIGALWEPRKHATKAGFHTVGNLFSEPSGATKLLKTIIQKELNSFYSEFKTHNNGLILNWPKKNNLVSWFVRMLQNGHQTGHIHTGGWVSGVVYLKTVDSPVQDEGAIEFGLHGFNYPVKNQDYPRQIYQPCNGDIILFPSSLFHRTIPVIKDVERCVIAFDLIV